MFTTALVTVARPEISEVVIVYHEYQQLAFVACSIAATVQKLGSVRWPNCTTTVLM